jgi:hypothetical protein
MTDFPFSRFVSKGVINRKLDLSNVGTDGTFSALPVSRRDISGS